MAMTYIITLDDAFYEDFLDAAGDFFKKGADNVPLCPNGIPIAHYILAWFNYQWFRNLGDYLPSSCGLTVCGKVIHCLTHKGCMEYSVDVDMQIKELLEKYPDRKFNNIECELADYTTIILREFQDG